MLKRTNSERVSADAKKKRCLDTAGESLSADTESEHLFPDIESTNASTEEVKGNPTLDTDDLDIPESLTLARVDREYQGPWEAEYSYGGEADLHRHYDSCAKNPGHKDFIPVDKFSKYDLPESYRHTDIVDYIRVLSDLTVRITVNYVSDMRPATVPFSGKPYPGYGNRGQRRLTVGTGWVDKVEINLDCQKTCECKDCRNSSTPETNFAVITIATAKHVVFDDLEAEHTTCHLFFDSGGTPDACSGVITLTDMKSKSSNIETDQYYMEHFTHDLQLGCRLLEACRHKDKLKIKLYKILPQITQVKRGWKVTEAQPLLLIVSHPHGCSKHISIGRWTSISYAKTRDVTYEYTAATCPGSSGALVVMPHKFKPLSLHQDLIYMPGAHCGTSEEQPGVNYFKAESLLDRLRMCFRNKDYKGFRMMLSRDEDLDIPDSLTLARVDREYQGPLEAEYSYGGEVDLHRHYGSCDKNPSHGDFIPVDKFSIEDLPEGYRHTDIVDYIRALADLTVRMTVNYVSDRRPMTAPGSGKPYPGYGNRGQRRMAVGTGWVDNVNIYLNCQNTCECKDCRNSSTPETNFAVITIATAKHVVFDDFEAEHTTCHLFFDSGGTPDACSGVVTLTGMKSKSSDIETDQYYMEHFTHDLQLGHRLLEACRHKDKLKSELHEILPQIPQHKRSLDVADKQPLLVIVSHPHGCRKHISIGRWTSLSYTKTGDSTYEYTAATCPGSSGTLVVMPRTCKPQRFHHDLIYMPRPHCGTSEEQQGVNYFKTEDFKNIRMKLSQDKEYEKIRHLVECGKFFPIV